MFLFLAEKIQLYKLNQPFKTPLECLQTARHIAENWAVFQKEKLTNVLDVSGP